MRWSCLLWALVACGGKSTQTVDHALVAQSVSALGTSSRPGMGALPYEGGTTFRVWAADAAKVFVVGDWNNWQPQELGNEQNGHFSADVPWASSWQKYKFVIENRSGSREERADPRSYRVENSSAASVIPYPGVYQWRHAFDMVENKELILYEMHLGTFNDAPGFGPGTFQSATAMLDHVRDLGVTAIALMPIAEFAADFSWGYNTSFPFAPETAYGTPEEMKNFVDEAHARGLAVLIDVVHNHYGPSDLPMWCFSGDCLGHGGHYFYTDARSKTPWGDTRPDFGRPQVRDFIADSISYWIAEYHLDGMRMDGTKYIRTTDGVLPIPDGVALLQRINSEVNSRFTNKVMIAEDFGAGDLVTRETQQGGIGFDSQWDGEFVHPIRDAIVTNEDAWRNMWRVKIAIEHRFNGQPLRRVIYTESHDEVGNGSARVPEEIWPGHADSWHSRKRSTLGAALLMTSPGIPLMLQGQEFLESGWFDDQKPLDWGNVQRHGSILQMYRDLIRLRRNWFANTAGLRGDRVNVFHVNDDDKLIAFHRWERGGVGDDVVVVANFSSQVRHSYRIGVPRAGTWKVRFNGDAVAYSGDFGNTLMTDVDARPDGADGLAQSIDVNVGAYSVVILSQ